MMFESRNRRISGLVYRKQQHLHLLFHYIADSHYKDELFLHYIGLSAKFSYICIIGAILGLFEWMNEWMNEGIYVRPSYRRLWRGCSVSTYHTLGYTVQFLVCYRNQWMSGSSTGICTLSALFWLFLGNFGYSTTVLCQLSYSSDKWTTFKLFASSGLLWTIHTTGHLYKITTWWYFRAIFLFCEAS